MLKIMIFPPESFDSNLKEIENPKALVSYFLDGTNFAPKLFMSNFCKQMIKDIDKSDVISTRCINSPWLGSITPKQLSGGVSMLLAVYFMCYEGRKDFYFASEYLGDNCVEYLLKIASKYDVNIWMTTKLEISKELFEMYPNKIYCMDKKDFINSKKDYTKTFITYEHKFLKKLDEEDVYDPEYEKFQEEQAELNIRRVIYGEDV